MIDGPAGAGKSTLARQLAHELGASLLDTGAIYRALAWLSDARGIAWSDEDAVARLCDELDLEFVLDPEHGQRVRVGEVDVTTAIRTQHIAEGASRVSALPQVRARLLGLQRAIAAASVESGAGCIAEGRDMGTVVFPEADFKFFLTADAEVRVERRLNELSKRGQAPSRAELRAEMATRDQRDSSRAAAPLVQAEDAVLLESSGLDADAVLGRVLAHIRAPTA